MATKILIEDQFTCTPEELYNLLVDDSFDDKLMASLNMGKEVRERKDTANGLTLKLRLTNPGEIPAPANKFTGKQLSYIEDRCWNKSNCGNTWVISPEVKGATVECKGTTEIIATATGCTRKTEGTISVNIPLIGKKIEEMVLKSIADTFNKNAEFCRNYIKNQKA